MHDVAAYLMELPCSVEKARCEAEKTANLVLYYQHVTKQTPHELGAKLDEFTQRFNLQFGRVRIRSEINDAILFQKRDATFEPNNAIKWEYIASFTIDFMCVVARTVQAISH